MKHTLKNTPNPKRLLRAVIAALVAGLTGGLTATASASVVLNGTRIVYAGDQASKTLQLSNEDDHPNLVQFWVEGDGVNDNDDAAPFIVNPPIFRMAAHAGQMVRLRYSGAEALPQDRESVFYLNFTQVPALPDASQDANQLVLLFQSRVKLFYRPQGLAAFEPSCERLQLHRDGEHVTVGNPSAYHLVVSRADVLTDKEKRAPLAQSVMVAPYSQARWALPPVDGKPVQLNLILRNDYGADVSHVCALS